ncbi:terminase small subunit [uncultured Ruegeria sp.]|uniref:terminase small subunit n=1 Tax=uncultured Ruegeria sp. TaxID=259304 RepID=UPI002630785F|nr:terminase small subunit [uncultured Ruegeria sp.]
MSNKVGRGRKLNRAEMAEFCGIALTTLDDWLRRGCPFEQRGSKGKAWVFNSAKVVSWRADDIRSETAGVQVASADELKRRKLEAETELVELELAEAKGLVAPIEQIDRAMAKAFGEVRANMRNVLPPRAASRIVGEKSETKVKAVLLEEIDLALEALADEDLITESDLETDEDGEDPD